MVFLHVDVHIQLHTTINVDFLGFAHAHDFGQVLAVLDFGLVAEIST